jgi:hypothetical protein
VLVILLAIDPGKDTGWATFIGGALVSCGLGFPNHNIDRAVIEKPQVYRRALSKGDPNDLITLAVQVGRYAERLEHGGARVDLVTPAEWKGQVPKDVHHQRIRKELTGRESDAVDLAGAPSRKLHNVLDAVGLGLWLLKKEGLRS